MINSPIRGEDKNMLFYRCYNIRADGKTIGLLNFEAINDTEAVVAAYKFRVDGCCNSVELWENGRQIISPVFPR